MNSMALVAHSSPLQSWSISAGGHSLRFAKSSTASSRLVFTCSPIYPPNRKRLVSAELDAVAAQSDE